LDNETFNKGEFIDSRRVQNSINSGKPEGNNGADRRNRPQQGRLRGIRFGEKIRGKAKSFWSLGSRRGWCCWAGGEEATTGQGNGGEVTVYKF